MLYGNAGTMKTRWACTADNPIVLDLENGMMSARDLNVNYLSVNTIDDFRAAYTKAKEVMTDATTLIVDSLTQLTDIEMHRIKEEIPQPRPDVAHDARIIYPRLYDRIIQKIDALLALPCDIIFICKETVAQRNDIHFSYPRLQGTKLTDEIPYMVDIIFHMYTQNDKKIANPCGTSTAIGKDRSGRLPKRAIKVEETPLAKIISYIKQEK